MLQQFGGINAPVAHPAHVTYSHQLLAQARRALWARVGDPRTEEVYAAWIGRFLEFAAPRCAGELDDLATGSFLAHLALAENVSPTALKRARRALLFLEIVVLGRTSGLATIDPRVA
jgi:hypothetical protein